MFLLRLLGALALVGTALCLLAWLLTGDPRYRALAGRVFRFGLMLAVVFLLLLFAERLLAPWL